MAAQAQPDNAGLSAHRILILTASIGAGHDVPAEVLATELREREPDAHVVVVNSLEALIAPVRMLLESGSSYESRLGNRLFDAQYWLITKFAPTRRLASWLADVGARRGLRRIFERERPDVIVSTYPGATEVIGRMRRRGELAVPVVSAITDLAALNYWAHPGVDLHLITHPESDEEVRRLAGGGAESIWVRGLDDPRFAEPMDQAEARTALGLADDRPLVVVSGGGWGVGDVAGAVEVALQVPAVSVIVLCGTNEGLRERVAERFAAAGGRVDAWGFTDRMPELLAAADALVHSTAGLTVLEAIVRGCPAISYGWGLGHIRANNRAFERFGLAAVVTDRAALAAELRRALASRPEPNRSFASRPTAASVILERLAAGGAGRPQ